MYLKVYIPLQYIESITSWWKEGDKFTFFFFNMEILVYGARHPDCHLSRVHKYLQADFAAGTVGPTELRLAKASVAATSPGRFG